MGNPRTDNEAVSVNCGGNCGDRRTILSTKGNLRCPSSESGCQCLGAALIQCRCHMATGSVSPAPASGRLPAPAQFGAIAYQPSCITPGASPPYASEYKVGMMVGPAPPLLWGLTESEGQNKCSNCEPFFRGGTGQSQRPASTAQFLGPGAGGGRPGKPDASLVVTSEVGYLHYENIRSQILPSEVAFKIYFIGFQLKGQQAVLCAHGIGVLSP